MRLLPPTSEVVGRRLVRDKRHLARAGTGYLGFRRIGQYVGLRSGLTEAPCLAACCESDPTFELVMVDTWEVFPADSDYAKSGDTVCQRSAEQRYQDWQAAMLATNEYPERRQILQMTFESSCETDSRWIVGFCLPGRRPYVPRHIKADIDLWGPKIKKGGVLMRSRLRSPVVS